MAFQICPCAILTFTNFQLLRIPNLIFLTNKCHVLISSQFPGASFCPFHISVSTWSYVRHELSSTLSNILTEFIFLYVPFVFSVFTVIFLKAFVLALLHPYNKVKYSVLLYSVVTFLSWFLSLSAIPAPAALTAFHSYVNKWFRLFRLDERRKNFCWEKFGLR